MKRILALLLCVVFALGLVACGGTEESPSSDTSSVNSGSVGGIDVSTQTDSENSDTSTSTEEKPAVQLYDPDMEHKVIMDDSGTKILIADLNLCGENPEDIVIEDCIIWEWDSANATGAKLQGKDIRIDDTILRYSSYWGKDVVVFSGSGGWVGIIDYETKEVLFEASPGYGPHAVELLPSGDLVVACSGNSSTADGRVLYYPISKGETTVGSYVSLKSAHGVCWDPTNDIIWALGDDEIIGCMIKDGKITKVGGMGASLKAIGQGGGHNLTPVYGQPGKYWVSGGNIMMFDANENTISIGYQRSSSYNDSDVKGIAWFPDGTMITTAHDQGGTGTYRSSEFRFLYLAYTTGKLKQVAVKKIMIPHREGSQTYKIHTLSKDYQ